MTTSVNATRGKKSDIDSVTMYINRGADIVENG
jgi:hypothetical protein